MKPRGLKCVIAKSEFFGADQINNLTFGYQIGFFIVQSKVRKELCTKIDLVFNG